MNKYERIIERLKEHLSNPEYKGLYPNVKTNFNLRGLIRKIRLDYEKYINKETGEFNEKLLYDDNDLILIEGYKILKENKFHFVNIDNNDTITSLKNTIEKLKEHLSNPEYKGLYPSAKTDKNLFQLILKIRREYEKYINKETRKFNEKLLYDDNNLILIEGYKILKENNFNFVNTGNNSLKNTIEKLKEHLSNPEYNGEYPNTKTDKNLLQTISKIRRDYEKYINKETGEFNEKLLYKDNDLILIESYKILKENNFKFINTGNNSLKNTIEKLKEHLSNPEYNGEYPNTKTDKNLLNIILRIRRDYEKYINKETGEFNEKLLYDDNDLILIEGYKILKENNFKFINTDNNHTIISLKNTIEKLKEHLSNPEYKGLYPNVKTDINLLTIISRIRRNYEKYINKETGEFNEKLLYDDNDLILIEGYKILKENNFNFVNTGNNSLKNTIEKLKEHLSNPEYNGEYPNTKTNINLLYLIIKIRKDYEKYINKETGEFNEKLLYKDNDLILIEGYKILKENNFHFVKIDNNDTIKSLKNTIEKLKEHLSNSEYNGEYPNTKTDKNLFQLILKIRRDYEKYINKETGEFNEELLYKDNDLILIEGYKILKENNFNFVNTGNNSLKNTIEKLKEHLANPEYKGLYPNVKTDTKLYQLIFIIRRDYEKYINKETGEFNEKLLYEDNDFILIEGYKLLKENNFKFTNEDSKKIIFDNSYKKYVENLNTDISRAELKQNHQKKFKEENEELFFNNYLGEECQLNYKRIKKSTNIINYKFKKLLEIGFFEDKYLSTEIKDLTKEEKQYRIREKLVFKITNGILNNKELLEDLDLNQDVNNIKEEIQLFIEDELENENKEYKDIYEMKGNNEQVVYKDSRKLLQYSYLKYKELYGEENRKKFHIIDDNIINPNNKGFDYTIVPNKELINQFNISKESKSYINVSYKYILGKSLGTSKTEDIFLVQYDDIENKTVKSKDKAKEIDDYVKKNSNVMSLLFNRAKDIIFEHKYFEKVHSKKKRKTVIEKEIISELPIITSIKFKDEKDNAITQIINDKDDGINKFNNTINKYVFEEILTKLNITQTKEKVLDDLKKLLKNNGYMENVYISDKGLALNKYIVKFYHREKFLRNKYKKEFGKDYSLEFYNVLKDDLEEIFKISHKLTNEQKLNWLDKNINLKKGDSIILENGEITNLLDYDKVKRNLKDISIDFAKISPSNSGFNFDITVKLKNQLLFEIKNNIFKGKQGMLLGTLRADLGNTKNMEINYDLLNKIDKENKLINRVVQEKSFN